MQLPLPRFGGKGIHTARIVPSCVFFRERAVHAIDRHELAIYTRKIVGRLWVKENLS